MRRYVSAVQIEEMETVFAAIATELAAGTRSGSPAAT